MRFALFLSGLLAAAAIVITSEGVGGSSTQYYDKGRFVSTENGQPGFGIEKDGSCWFVAENQRVRGGCDEMMNSVKDTREQMMAGLSEQERAMMQQMQSRYMQQKKAPEIKEVASQRIAGLDGNRCYEVGGPNHLVCVNKKLLDKVKKEMGGDFYQEMQARFADMADDMGMGGMGESALARLGKQGVVMKDVQTSMAMGGMSMDMLNFLPPEQREAIMQQMKSAGAGAEMQGMTVTSVNENGSIPSLNLSVYPSVSYQEYMQRMMSRMPGMR